jgi:ABC-type transport system substrate-binding protein
MRRGPVLAFPTIAAVAISALSFSAFAQQPGQTKMTCTTIQASQATTITRCQHGSAQSSALPQSGTTTDPAAAGKPYGTWGNAFGGQRWEAVGK